MGKELENRLLILYAIIRLGGSSNKKDVLDFLQNQDLIILDEKDQTILKSRAEVKWRNELAYVRYHLVELFALYQEEWAITSCGKKYYNLLTAELKKLPKQHVFHRIKHPDVFEYIENTETEHKVKEDFKDANTASEYEALVKCRKGQGQFRTDLIEVCGGKCRVTGYSDTTILIASHIKPWRLCFNKEEKLDRFNGLLLLPNLDKLFDNNLITFDATDGHIVISEQVRERELLGLNENMAIQVFDENRKYLEYHNQKLFKDRDRYYPPKNSYPTNHQ